MQKYLFYDILYEIGIAEIRWLYKTERIPTENGYNLCIKWDIILCGTLYSNNNRIGF